MLEYKTTGIIRVNGGYIGLDEKQAGDRRSRIKATKDKGLYEVVRPIMFKAGERVRLANPDKVTLENLDCLEKPVEPEPAKKQAPVKKVTSKKTVNKK